jgi:hypothetical protein
MSSNQFNICLVSFGELSSDLVVKETKIKPIVFNPPDFGFTVLGNSHGFDHCGSTSGFII